MEPNTEEPELPASEEQLKPSPASEPAAAELPDEAPEEGVCAVPFDGGGGGT